MENNTFAFTYGGKSMKLKRKNLIQYENFKPLTSNSDAVGMRNPHVLLF